MPRKLPDSSQAMELRFYCLKRAEASLKSKALANDPNPKAPEVDDIIEEATKLLNFIEFGPN